MTKVEKDYHQHLGKLVYQMLKGNPKEQSLYFIESMDRLGGWWHYRLTPIGAKRDYHPTVLCKELHYSLTNQPYTQNHARYNYRLANEESNG